MLDSNTFYAEATGKWILSGEHAVLRGAQALVFPVQSKKMKFSWSHQDSQLKVLLNGEFGPDLEIVISALLDRACDLLQMQRSDLKGVMTIDSELPIGSGLGASAAICVGITRWLAHLGHLTQIEDQFLDQLNIKEHPYFQFALNLENLFHGESSGVDVAVALTKQPLIFQRDGDIKIFKNAWCPIWGLSYSGQRGMTKDCVNKVKSLIEKNPQLGIDLDNQMKKASQICLDSLKSYCESSQGNLILGMNLALDCFRSWGLTKGSVDEHIQELISEGALAVKPTGSGGGGYVLSLWKEWPTHRTDLIRG